MKAIDDEVVLICAVDSRLRLRPLRKASTASAFLLVLAACFAWAGEQMMMVAAICSGSLVLIGALLKTTKGVDRTALERALVSATEDSPLRQHLAYLREAQNLLESDADQRTAEVLRADRKSWWTNAALVALPLVLALFGVQHLIGNDAQAFSSSVQYAGVMLFLVVTVFLFVGPYPTLRALREENLEKAVWCVLMVSQQLGKERA